MIVSLNRFKTFIHLYFHHTVLVSIYIDKYCSLLGHINEKLQFIENINENE